MNVFSFTRVSALAPLALGLTAAPIVPSSLESVMESCMYPAGVRHVPLSLYNLIEICDLLVLLSRPWPDLLWLTSPL